MQSDTQHIHTYTHKAVENNVKILQLFNNQRKYRII